MNTNSLIERIGYFRNKANLSARELSLQIGKSENYINKLESKDFMLPISVLFEVIAALGITCDEFFSDNYADYKQDKEILNLLKSLPKDRKNSFIDLMKNSK